MTPGEAVAQHGYTVPARLALDCGKRPADGGMNAQHLKNPGSVRMA